MSRIGRIEGSASYGAERLEEGYEDEKSAELARRLREAGSLTSSHLPAGFCKYRNNVQRYAD